MRTRDEVVQIDDPTTSNAVHGPADTVVQAGSIDSVSVTSHPARPGWWLGAAFLSVVAAAALVVTAVDRDTDVTGRAVPAVLFPTEVPTEPVRSPDEPIHVDSVRYLNVPRVGSTFAFPGGTTPTPQQVAELDDLQRSGSGDYAARARQLGGVGPHDVAVQIALRGVSTETAVITDMHALSKCGEPLTGTLLLDPPAGLDVTPQIGFDLDRPTSPAQVYTAGDLSGSYFLDHTISVKPGETQVVLVHGVTATRHCEFRVGMTVNAGVGAAGVQQVVDDGGKPFEVTAVSEAYSDFERIYAGGVASPDPDGRFVEVDPATYGR